MKTKQERNVLPKKGNGFRKIDPMRKAKFSHNKTAPNVDFFVRPKKTDICPSASGSSETQRVNESERKPFNKKLYRMKKYSKKYKVEQWEKGHKKTVLKEYYKQIKEEDRKFDVQKIYEQEECDNENNLNTDINQSVGFSNPAPAENKDEIKKRIFKNAKFERERIKEEKQAKREEFEKKKAEREKARLEMKKQKMEKYKKLNKKTKKGQPIMKDRMEMLLEEIQAKFEQENKSK